MRVYIVEIDIILKYIITLWIICQFTTYVARVCIIYGSMDELSGTTERREHRFQRRREHEKQHRAEELAEQRENSGKSDWNKKNSDINNGELLKL